MKLTSKEWETLNRYLNTVKGYIQDIKDTSPTSGEAPSREDACYCLGKIDGILSMCVTYKEEENESKD